MQKGKELGHSFGFFVNKIWLNYVVPQVEEFVRHFLQGTEKHKTEKPPDCSSDGFVLVGDERIELPQVESESTALPLCKSPIFYLRLAG